jgi:hypothetical protein
MPIWFEVIVLMLVFYGAGVLLGWAIWNTSAEPGAENDALEGEDH